MVLLIRAVRNTLLYILFFLLLLFFLRSLSANERSAALYAFLFVVAVRKRTSLNVSDCKGTYKK